MATNPDLHGKVALITGASRGIGADVARVFAREGATVLLAARTENEGEFRVPGSLSETVASIIESGGNAVAHRCDLGDEEDVTKLWEWAVAEAGHVDIVINNAGISPPGTIENMNWKHFHLGFQINVASPGLLSRLAAPHMRALGGGAIVNVSSGASRGPGVGPYKEKAWRGTVYGLTKSAIERMTQGMAAELCEDNISVNAIKPSRQIWVGGTIYVASQRPGFEDIDLTGKRKDGTIMGDAAAAIVRADHALCTGNIWSDEEALTAVTGTTDFTKYATY